jgi:hypothetical protein
MFVKQNNIFCPIHFILAPLRVVQISWWNWLKMKIGLKDWQNDKPEAIFLVMYNPSMNELWAI